MLDLWGLHEEVATLTLEVFSLAESHILVSHLFIPSFTQPLPKRPSLVFDLFIQDDVTPFIGAKRGWEVEKLGYKEYQHIFKRPLLSDSIDE